METQPTKSLFDVIPSKTAFIIGFVTAILTLGTLGFVIMGSCALTGGCNVSFASDSDDAEPSPTAAAAAAAAAAAKTTAPTTGNTVAVSSIPAVDKDDHVQGKDDATVTIVEYSDYQCPFCSRFHPTVKAVSEAYGDKVRWIYRHFPLSFHPEAKPAAEAAECAGEQGKFWEYSDKLFANQSTLGSELYTKLASELGLNTSKFESCLSSDKYLSHIDEDATGGAAAGVSGTPGTFIYATKGGTTATVIKGAQSEAAVKAAVDALLK